MTTRPPLAPALAAFAAVLAAQLGLVAAAGTDVPFHDAWDVEGGWLYPAWRDGTLRLADVWRAHNEHRIVWTHLWNLALFAADGQWDPLVQLAANATVRAAAAALLVRSLAEGSSRRGAWGWAAGVASAFLPHLPWHNALWGFQSQVYFALLFSVGALALLNRPETMLRLAAGLALGLAALLAMGPAALLPLPLLALGAWQSWRAAPRDRAAWRQCGAGAALLGAALLLRGTAPGHDALHPATGGGYFAALARLLAWPHVDEPWAAAAMNLPLAIFVVIRLRRAAPLARPEALLLLLAGWALAIAGATAWARGGAAEMAGGVPSRYVDFLVLLPLANAACALALARELAAWRPGKLLAGAWAAFVLVGWAGLSAQVMRGIVRPRAADRAAPVRLLREFQRTRDPAVFAGQPRLLVPHPTPPVVLGVLDDPRLRGALPPSLQPAEPMGPLSRGVRALLGRQ